MNGVSSKREELVRGQGTVNAKITASDFVVALEKGRKKPALSGRAKNSTETILPVDQYRWLVHLVSA